MVRHSARSARHSAAGGSAFVQETVASRRPISETLTPAGAFSGEAGWLRSTSTHMCLRGISMTTMSDTDAPMCSVSPLKGGTAILEIPDLASETYTLASDPVDAKYGSRPDVAHPSGKNAATGSRRKTTRNPTPGKGEPFNSDTTFTGSTRDTHICLFSFAHG